MSLGSTPAQRARQDARAIIQHVKQGGTTNPFRLQETFPFLTLADADWIGTRVQQGNLAYHGLVNYLTRAFRGPQSTGGLGLRALPPARLPPANRLVLYGGLGLVALALTGAVFGLSGAVGYYKGAPRLLVLKRIALPNRYLVPAAARAFSAMSEQAARDGVTLRVNSAYRSYGEQAALYAAHCAKGLARGKWAPPAACVPDPPTAKPGRSTHQIGLSVDIQTDDGTNAASRWLDSNAGRYGFVRDVAGEPWHVTFRGQGSALAGLSLGDGCYGCGGC